MLDESYILLPRWFLPPGALVAGWLGLAILLAATARLIGLPRPVVLLLFFRRLRQPESEPVAA